MRLPSHGWIARHFRHLATLSMPRFVFRVAIESIAVSIAAALPLVWLLPDTDSSREDLEFVEAVIFAPLVETLLFQALLVRVAQFFTRRFWVLLIAGWIPFGMFHFVVGIGSGLIAGLMGGFYLGFSYAVWSRHSHVRAFLVTAGVHAIGNLVAWSLYKIG